MLIVVFMYNCFKDVQVRIVFHVWVFHYVKVVLWLFAEFVIDYFRKSESVLIIYCCGNCAVVFITYNSSCNCLKKMTPLSSICCYGDYAYHCRWWRWGCYCARRCCAPCAYGGGGACGGACGPCCVHGCWQPSRCARGRPRTLGWTSGRCWTRWGGGPSFLLE